MKEYPVIPDDDGDFTPAIARKIVALYQVHNKALFDFLEEAEEARDKFEKLATDLYYARAEAERQRNEAFAAGAEAMREACAKYMEERGWPTHAEIFRALPIPTQEVNDE